MSSNEIYSTNFKPTCLMIKQHSVSGLMYLCKSTNQLKATTKYLGSGSKWKNHIEKHGKEFVETIWYCWFFEKESLVECALMLSELYDIVNSDKWANLIQEDGLGGFLVGHNLAVGENNPNFGNHLPVLTREQYNRIGQVSSTRKWINNGTEQEFALPEQFEVLISIGWVKGRLNFDNGINSQDTIEKSKRTWIEKYGTDNPSKSQEIKNKISLKLKRKVVCPNCGKEGGISAMKRHHFDNCKLKD